MDRGSLQLEDLLKVVLILVIAWLTLGLIERALGIVTAGLRPLSSMVPGVHGIPGGSVIALIIVLAVLVWLLD